MSIDADLQSVTFKLNSGKIRTLNLNEKDWKSWKRYKRALALKEPVKKNKIDAFKLLL